MRRLISVTMVLLLLASLTACGKKGDDAQGQGSGGGVGGAGDAKQYVFAEETTVLSGQPGIKDVFDLFYDGTSLYVQGSHYNEETHLSEPSMFRLSPEGKILTKIDLPQPEGKYTDYSRFKPRKNGGFIAVRTTYDLIEEGAQERTAEELEDAEAPENDPDKEEYVDPVDYTSAQYSLIRCDPDGEIEAELELTLSGDAANNNMSYIEGVHVIHKDDFEYLFLMDSWHGMFLYDVNSMELVNTIHEGADPEEAEDWEWFETFSYQDEIYKLRWGTSEEGYEIRIAQIIDLKTGEATGEELTLPGNAYDVRTSIEESAFAFYQLDNGNFYGYNFGDTTTTKLMDTIDSDITADSISGSVILNEKEMYALYYNGDGQDKVLAHLIKVPPEEVTEKEILTFGGTYLSNDVRKHIVKFNRSNDTCRIRFIDYASYNNESNEWLGAINQLNNDIITGNTPDLLILDNDSMPINSYILKGVFADLNPFLEQDPEIKREDLLENVLSALEVNGGLYQIGPSINIMTVVGRESDVKGVNGEWTMEDCIRIIDGYGGDYLNAFGFTHTRADIFNTAMRLCGNAFIDWETQTCSYDSDAFVSLLEFAGKFPVEIPDEIWMNQSTEDYRRRKSHFTSQMIYTYDMYGEQKYGVFGEDVRLLGFPYDGKTNYASITMDLQLAMSDSCKHKEEAWEFLRLFLLPEYQDSITYAYPMCLSSLDKMAKRSMEPAYYENSEGKKEYYDREYYLGETSIKLPNLSQEDVDTLTAYIKSVNYMQYTDRKVLEIIEEETAAFFSGQKTAKEVADIIQNRVRMYVGEVS